VNHRVFVGVVVIVVAGVVAAALVMLGPPSEERARQLDRRRVGDLGQLSRSVQAYVDRHRGLPPTLQALSDEPGVQLERDPETGASYDYQVLDASRYQLCAQFAAASEDNELRTWSHGPGRQCFVQSVKVAGPE